MVGNSMRTFGSTAISCAFLIVALQSSNASADDMAEGQKLYQAGRIREAAAYFARSIDTNSYNAAAHYFLGNCLVAEKNYTKAKEEYRLAMEETEDKKMESYCRTALAKLQAYSDTSAIAPTAPLVDRNAPSGGDDVKTERVKAIIAKGQQDAKQVIDRAEERCKPIMEDEKAALAQMNIKLRGRSGSLETTTSDERDDAKKEFENKLLFIRKDAKDQARVIMDRARNDATSVGRGLPNLEDLLEGK
jgi:tetratricopeptide (TPR) repeat protein